MRLRAVSLLTGTTFARAAALVIGLAISAGCGGRPGSPEDLYAQIAELNAKGETGRIWDLLTDDAREREKKGIDDLRTLVQRNPGAEKLVRQYKCTKEELYALSYVELYRRENLGNDRAFVDATIKDKHADPNHPGDIILTVENPFGTTFYLRTRPVSGGWGLVQVMTRGK